jgi:hypothetical protein
MVSSIFAFWSIFAIFISVSGYQDIAHLIYALSVRNYDHSSSRISPGGDSTSLVRVSSVSDGIWTGPTDPALASSFTSAAAALTCMRPSSANLRVKRAISESYCSHSGIFRARASFGSFCVRRAVVCEFRASYFRKVRTVSGFWQRSMVLALWSLSSLPEKKSYNLNFT